MVKRHLVLLGCLLSSVYMTTGFASGHSGDVVASAAIEQLGTPYRFGANGPEAFDCSGLAQWSYRAAGINLPRTSAGQRRAGRSIPLAQAQRGDLIFFRYENRPQNGRKAGSLHVAIYIGQGRAVHAPSTGGHVEVIQLDHVHWRQRLIGAVRVLKPTEGQVEQVSLKRPHP